MLELIAGAKIGKKLPYFSTIIRGGGKIEGYGPKSKYEKYALLQKPFRQKKL